MSEIELLRGAFKAVPEPSEASVALARADLMRVFAAEPGLAWWRPSRRLRVALVVIGLVLALAGIATATYLGVRLVFTTVPTTLAGGEAEWSNFVLAPGGSALYAIRVPRARVSAGALGPPIGFAHPGAPQIMRITGINHGGRVQARLVTSSATFAGSDLRLQAGSVESPNKLAVASNGDVFLIVRSSSRSQDVLFVVRRDGSLQKIVTGKQLIRSGLFPKRAGITFNVAASRPDRVWLWAEPWEGTAPQKLFEVVDPNADGIWTDRIIRPIALPRNLPRARGASLLWGYYPDWRWQIVGEPALPGRPPSLLAAVLFRQTGEFRIYRIRDLNGDADALDPGEVQLLYDRPNGVAGEYPQTGTGGAPQIAPVLVQRGRINREEIAVAGLKEPDRISLLSDSGDVTDIARTFANSTEWPANGLSLAAGTHGELYVISAESSTKGLSWGIYRVAP